MSTNEPSHLFFTSKDDPREDCIIIGFTYGSSTATGTDKPIFFRFTTKQISPTESRTTVTRDAGQVVAQFNWEAHIYPGLLTIGSRHHPLNYLAIKNKITGARIFQFNGEQFEWRKVPGRTDSYDLYRSKTNIQIAAFRRESRKRPSARHTQ